MPRVYVPKPGAKTRKKYNELVIKEALDELSRSDASINSVAQKYGISKSVLGRHKLHNIKSSGGQTALSADTEKYIVQNLNTCAEWGYPLTTLDLRYVVKMYLDTLGIQHRRFKNNLPGPDFVDSFLKRHKNDISKRICQNIKRSRAKVSPETIKEYHCELEKSIADVPLSDIINYDETNLTDDPGRKQVIVKRGCKYPERVMNHTKGSVSLMMAASADGVMLPPYVVYKAAHLYNTWVGDGPKDARYNRSGSGWFDGEIFADWIKTIVIPVLENRPGKKVLIGDNLSSHLSADLIRLCKEKNIHFVFLPTNSTHLTQPLDVAFFRPMKTVWRQIIEKWKNTDGRNLSTIPKGCFPRLLKLLMEQLQLHSENNIKAGFRKTGVSPLDVNIILERLPKYHTEIEKKVIDETFTNFLKEMRFGTMNIREPKNKRKLEVVAGRSVSGEEADTAPAIKKTKSKPNQQECPSLSGISEKGKRKKSKLNSLSITLNKEEDTYRNFEPQETELDCNDITQTQVVFIDNLGCSKVSSQATENKNSDEDVLKISEGGKIVEEQKLQVTPGSSISEEKAKIAPGINRKKLEPEKRDYPSISRKVKGKGKKIKQSVLATSGNAEVDIYKNFEQQVIELDSVDVMQMPIFFADSSDCNEVIINSKNQFDVKHNINSNINESSKIKIISNIKLPVLPEKNKKSLLKDKKNYYEKTEEILKILEE